MALLSKLCARVKVGDGLTEHGSAAEPELITSPYVVQPNQQRHVCIFSGRFPSSSGHPHISLSSSAGCRARVRACSAMRRADGGVENR